MNRSETSARDSDRAPSPTADAADPPAPAARGLRDRLRHGRMRHQALVLFAVCCLALGGVFVRLSQTGPVASGAYRSLFAVPMLFGLSSLIARRPSASGAGGARTRSRISRRDYLIIGLGGIFLASDLCLWNISFLYTTLAESNLLANLVPFVLAPLCYLLFRERVPRRLAWPAALALVGLYILVILGTRLNPEHLRGDALALSTAVFYALFLLVAKGLRERHEATRIMASLSLVCALVCFGVAAVLREKLLPENAKGWLILIALAISSQILGQTLMAHAVKFLPLQLAAVFILFQPVAAAIYGLVFFDQRLGLDQLAGIGILIVAIYWAKNILEGNDETRRDRSVRASGAAVQPDGDGLRQAADGVPAAAGDPR